MVDGLQSDDPTTPIQPVMEALREASGVDYITVVDMNGIRVSHPDPAEIGRPVSSDHSLVRQGNEFVGTEEGPVGVTFRVKVPVRAADGTIVGTLSVGVIEERLTADVIERAWQLIGVAAAAVVIGSALSWLVSRTIRRRLYGVDPDELRTLLQTRDSMLAGVSDGFIAVDQHGRVALANAAAEALIGRGNIAGRTAADVLPESLIRLVSTPPDAGGRHPLTGLLPRVVQGVGTESAGEAPRPVAVPDRAQLELDGLSLVVTRSEASLAGRHVGTTLLFQNRTELEHALAELDAQKARANAMRRATHEFENRMHVIGGLLGLGEFDEASRVLESAPAGPRPGIEGDSGRDLSTVSPPLLAAFLDSRISAAAALGVRIDLAPDSLVEADTHIGPDTITVIGNLVANAVEAAESRVDLYLRGDADGLAARVEDDGPGVPPERRGIIFEEGISSKPRTEEGRGIGLHLVARLVASHGGTIDVDDAELGGAAFDVWLPAADADADAGTSVGSAAPPPERGSAGLGEEPE